MRHSPAWLKPVVDFVPLGIFLIAYQTAGLMTATAALIVASMAAVALSFFFTRKLAMMPLFTAIIVGVFGGLTLWLNDETFIKMKPTIVYLVFATIIAGGLALRRPVLKALLGGALPLNERGWQLLSLRFLFFFLAMAAANEVLRRVLSTDDWVLWKVPGSIGLTLLFLMAQAPLLLRHRLPAGDTPPDNG